LRNNIKTLCADCHSSLNEFKKFANFEALASRLQSASLTFTAKSNENLIGMIELMNNCHIARFFVRKSYQKQGIGKGLLRYVINLCLKQHPDTHKFTVNSSPNAVSAYEKMEFNATDHEQISNGIRFTPMELNLNRSDRNI
jgi:GNAT superfamily N-acetyltransferase